MATNQSYNWRSKKLTISKHFCIINGLPYSITKQPWYMMKINQGLSFLENLMISTVKLSAFMSGAEQNIRGQ